MSSTTSTPSSTGEPQPTATLSSSSYFFGFLIAFIAFLFVFLSLGLVARRRRMRLMRDFLLYGPDDAPDIPAAEPLMWQPSYAEAQGQLWSDIMPLSTSLVQHEVVDDKAPAEVPPPPSSNPFVTFFGFSTNPPRKPSLRKIHITEALNIAVVIEMPQDSPLKEAEGHEYLIGTLQAPWKEFERPGTER
ncbi:hypothetical protein C8F04DRAFT_1388180 [Mycena alexandri]|uniref:Uncharacterized protein n=1 Tax=Mycena alexandri TaxID=1745969 RepID=A0AAD6XHN8_9AGAR|nr:hypothetical protein C8F04DRAFT_1388180 [Mycena alexandri]